MKKLTPVLLSAVLMFGAAACNDGGAKTAGGSNSDTTKTDTTASNNTGGASPSASTEASPSASTAASPGASTAASPSGSTTANAGGNNDAAKPDKAAQNDATSDVRKAQANSDIRAREQRNNATGGDTKRANGDLESEVRSKLEVNIPKSKLEVKAKDGAVTVTGAVPNQTDLAKIDTLAKEIKGVKSVQNQAKVVPAKQ